MTTEWCEQLDDFFKSSIYIQLQKFLDFEYKNYEIFPNRSQVLRAFQLTDFNDVKVVILGQDPYHGLGQANGLAFSVNQGIKLPPSLCNIYRELSNDLKIPMPQSGDLTPWANQGVLLLNTVLSVRKGQAHSHANAGWELLTTLAIKKLSERKSPVVFILWGKQAQSMSKFIDLQNHFIIQSSHPSPLSSYRGFFGSRPFSKTNHLLIKCGKSPINWSLA